MAIYRYIVTVNAEDHVTTDTGQRIADEIDSNLESAIDELGIEHFTVEPLSAVYLPAAQHAEWIGTVNPKIGMMR